MKAIKRITSLAALVSGIVIFWLLPGINKADDTYYTRIYEDTDKKNVSTPAPVQVNMRRAGEQDTTARPRKKYRRERIHSADKLSDVNVKMFSRAIQFKEDEMIVLEDTVKEVHLAQADSLKQVQ
jgi:hypothetical protein